MPFQAKGALLAVEQISNNIDYMNQKRCSRCSENKPTETYVTGQQTSPWCRDCRLDYKRQHRAKFREQNPRKRRIRSDIVLSDGTFVCQDCRLSKPIADKKAGNQFWCKPCYAVYASEKRRASGIKQKVFSVIKDDEKSCLACNTFKAISEFSPTARGRGGVSAYCKDCAKEKFYDPEKARQSTQRYRANNLERWRAMHRVNMFKRRHKIMASADGTVTDDFLKGLYNTESCVYCNKETPPSKRTADHVIPLIRGGAHSAFNLVMACMSCNSSKKDLLVEEWKNAVSG
jgi:5-methylcytosine-specific restriction endonuclease McrA